MQPDSSVHCGFSRRFQPGIAGRTTPRRSVIATRATHIRKREGEAVKTLAIRLEEDQHAQLSMIAQLEELTVTDAIRQAIEQWIESKRSNPQLQQRAEAVLEAIEQEAATRRGAIAALLGDESSSTDRAGRPGRRSSGRAAKKGGDDASG